MLLRRPHRLRIALTVIGCLLFQQVAMAAYACTMTRMPAVPVAMIEDCAGMGMEVDQESLALCAKLCAPDLSILGDHVAVSVPSLALPAAFELVLAAPASRSAFNADVPIDRSDRPPRLRYCSLLI